MQLRVSDTDLASHKGVLSSNNGSTDYSHQAEMPFHLLNTMQLVIPGNCLLCFFKQA